MQKAINNAVKDYRMWLRACVVDILNMKSDNLHDMILTVIFSLMPYDAIAFCNKLIEL